MGDDRRESKWEEVAITRKHFRGGKRSKENRINRNRIGWREI